MTNGFGERFHIEIYGASHAPSLGVRIEGVPANMELSEADFAADLERRRSGRRGTTPRREGDVPHILSGVKDSVTDGTLLEIAFCNENTRSSDYEQFRYHPRPSHVDLVARRKYGEEFDLRGGGPFSGRMTLPMVAAGVVAKRILGSGVRFTTTIVEIGGERDSAKFDEVVEAAMRDGDSVGGVIECRISGIECGVGEPMFDSVESVAAHILFAIPAVKGVEFGSGFAGVALRGSARNDAIIDADGRTRTNNEGGINGGIANGNDIVVRVAIKPTPTISCQQQTYHFGNQQIEPLNAKGRHDACIALRAGVVVEAAMAIALADLTLQK